jgi:hypothetical protein
LRLLKNSIRNSVLDDGRLAQELKIKKEIWAKLKNGIKSNFLCITILDAKRISFVVVVFF